MIINKLNLISKQSFNAVIGPNLQAEIDNKRETLQRLPNRKRSVSVSKFNSYIQEIQDTLPNLSVEIDKNNPKEYLLKYKFFTDYLFIKPKIFRHKDEKSFQYSSLRNGLKNLNNLFNKIAKHEYTYEERERLKEWEAGISPNLLSEVLNK